MIVALIWLTLNVQCPHPYSAVTIYEVNKQTDHLLLYLYIDKRTVLPNPFTADRFGKAKVLLRLVSDTEIRYTCKGGLPERKR